MTNDDAASSHDLFEGIPAAGLEGRPASISERDELDYEETLRTLNAELELIATLRSELDEIAGRYRAAHQRLCAANGRVSIYCLWGLFPDEQEWQEEHEVRAPVYDEAEDWRHCDEAARLKDIASATHRIGIAMPS